MGTGGLDRGVILGTAGHIDHGKTALVKALTGVDTDRLPEEKRRGITIDLGFAPLHVEGIGTIGIVDVPGHEAFVRTMLAGASGIDIALLVVAADEGVMPQTREHLEILSLLAVPRAVVALTKCDLVSGDWLALAIDDVRTLLAETRFAPAPIVPVSAITGFGLPQLRDAIRNAANSGARLPAGEDLFRMPVDRAFTVKGTGTVVTGTVWSGTIDRDTIVSVYPPGKRSRVRGIQHHGMAVTAAQPSQRVALALSDLDVEEIGRGSVVVAEGAWAPTRRVEARIHLTGRDVDISPRTRLRFHLGTADVGARMNRLDRGGKNDSEDFLATVSLEESLLVRGGDRFVLRLPSPALTIGGGVVDDPFPSGRRRRVPHAADDSALVTVHRSPRSHAELKATEEFRIALLGRMARQAGLDGLAVDLLPIRLGVAPGQVSALAQQIGLVQIHSRFYQAPDLERLEHSIEAFVLKQTENFSLEAGVQLQSVRAALRAPSAAIEWSLQSLVANSRLEVHGSLATPAGWSPKLNSRESALVSAILHQICIQPSEPPGVAELVGSFGERTPDLLRYLERSGELIRVSDDRYYSTAGVEGMVGRLRAVLERERIYSPAELREVLGVSRKYLIPFLEYCDVTGVTERKAEGRVLVA